LDRVSVGQKLALGCGGITTFFGSSSVKTIAVPIYQMTLGVNPALLGLAMALPRFWDAFVDPIIGNLSDNCQARWGRRRPFIVVGAILSGVAFSLIWMVPQGWGQMPTLAYFMATSLLFYTCFTVFSVPFNSLKYEITPDYHERTRVMAYPTFFSKIAEAGYTWIIPLAQLAVFGSLIVGIRVVGWAAGLLVMALLGIIPRLLVKERFARPGTTIRQDRVRFWPSLLQSLKNHPFRILLILIGLQVLAGTLASGFDYYLLVYYVCDGSIKDGSFWKAWLSSGYAAVGFISVFLIGWLASRVEKRTVLVMSYSLVAFGGLAKWFVFTPGAPWLIMLDPILCGTIYAAIGIIIPSMLADICDEDERQSYQRREGMYESIFSCIKKTGVSFAFFGSGLALVLVGFDEQLGGSQGSTTILLMRVIFAGSTTLIAILAIVVLCFYPITEQTARETRQILEARRGAVDRV
jgi:GPH family glycoside/pentoside/hexuronide:cation symporter